jgi:hypothetical protein
MKTQPMYVASGSLWTATPSTTVYAAMVSPVAKAASSAGVCRREGRPPMKTSAISPAEISSTPASSSGTGSWCSTTIATTATTQGDVPRASG